MILKKFLGISCLVAGLAFGAAQAEAKVHLDVGVDGVPVFGDSYVYGETGWGDWGDRGTVWAGDGSRWGERDYHGRMLDMGYSEVQGGCDGFECDYYGYRDGHRHHYRIDQRDGRADVRRHR